MSTLAAPSGRRAVELPQHQASRRSPFSSTTLSVLAAAVFAAATVVWLAAGARLPGGRWLAVHLFTLGVLSNAVWGFSRHFAHRLTVPPASDRLRAPLVVAFNLGAVVMLTGVAQGVTLAIGVGATVTTAVVLGGWWHLRGRRRAAPDTRFAWIVRMYERAHGAFVHGAVLGTLLGLGLLPSGWHGAARDAHLHVMVLGWGGLTLAATLVFFGPALLRTRMEAGADEQAARALPRGASALTVAVLAMLLGGLGGPAGRVSAAVAAAGLAVFTWAMLSVTRPLLRAAASAKPYVARGPIIGVCIWLPTALVLDVAGVALGQRQWLEGAGIILLVGALAQAVLAVLLYLTPMLRGATFAARERWQERTLRLAGVRAFVLNTGVAVVGVAATLGPAAGPGGAVVVRVGWTAVAVGVVAHLAVLLWPTSGRPVDVSEAVTRRGAGTAGG
jgi:hypothetical protein